MRKIEQEIGGDERKEREHKTCKYKKWKYL